jgi:hypothetical protein
LKRGWVPHDEGALGQSAERVFNGELPHRDFDDIYTGGLTFVHALAFREFGVNLASPRYVLFAFFVLWVPATYYIASRFVSAYWAGAVVLLCVAWSVPNYSAAMPSWYNLFFATFGTAALLRYLEAGFRGWLWIAGICGGLSILAKITGLYFVAGALLFFIFREQGLARARTEGSSERGRFYSATMLLGLAAFVTLVAAMIHRVPGMTELLFFLFPSLVLAILLLVRELAGIPGSDRKRFTTLFRMIFPFAAGIAIPIVVFLVPYLLSGFLSPLFNGAFALPTKRFTFATLPAVVPPAVAKLMVLLATLVALSFIALPRRVFAAALAVGLACALLISAKSARTYELAWYCAAISIPAVVLAGAVILQASRFGPKLTVVRQEQLMLLLWVTALTSLVQFPFSAPVYFCYVAPLAFLAASAVFASIDQPPRFVLGTLLVFYLLFAVLRITPGFIYSMGISYSPDLQTERLALARAGGLRTNPSLAELYDRMIPLIQSHAKGKYIYAAPDCPEVYFLSGLQNPTRTLFEFLDAPEGRTERVLKALESHDVSVIAIHDDPQFSHPVEPALRKTLEKRFPNSVVMGAFQVRWLR